MARKKKLTLKQQYKKELKRIERFIHRASKRGFTFSDDAVPKMPKRVTQKALLKVKQLSPEELYKKATYISPGTQEVLTGIEGRKRERSAAAKKSAQTRKTRAKQGLSTVSTGETYSPPQASDVILSSIEEIISQWQPLSSWSEEFADIKRADKDITASILAGAIARDGKDTVAKRCESAAVDMIGLVYYIIYGESGDKKDLGVQAEIAVFMQYVTGGTLSQEEQEEIQTKIERSRDGSSPFEQSYGESD